MQKRNLVVAIVVALAFAAVVAERSGACVALRFPTACAVATLPVAA